MTTQWRWCISLVLGILALLFTASLATAQGYVDANNLSEAAGMLRAQGVTLGTFEELCAHGFPDRGPVLSRAVVKWKRDHERVIEAADKFVQRMIRSTGRDPTPTLEASLRRLATQQFRSLGIDAQRRYCEQLPAELESGAWDSRTPNVYRFLEEYANEP